MSKIKIISFFAIFILAASVNSKIVLDDESLYQLLYRDLKNYNNYGYKSRLWENKEIIQGSLYKTELNTHLAIDGKGFFKVTKNNDSFFTRKGNFYINKDGYFLNSDGYILIKEGNIPDDININTDIYFKNNSIIIKTEKYNRKIKINLYLIEDFSTEDGVYFKAKKNIEDTESNIVQGFLEISTTIIPKTLIEMNFVLNRISKKKNTTFNSIDIKKDALSSLINYCIFSYSSNDLYKYNILESLVMYLDPFYE